ncbi:MAG: prolipoprotein diacylglyceryl transferase [Actinomycetales bacterium]|nr:prolipoprotein diacylglyceryl transferase [Actinomycetales bacterium]
MIPLSIPSPPADWQVLVKIPLGWLHGLIPAVSADAVVEVRTYAVCIIAGIIAAVLIANYRLTKRGAEPWIVIDIAVWAVVIAIIAARFYHVFTHPGDYFGEGKNVWNPFQPGSIWAIWEGGNAIFGALIGGAVGVFIATRITGLRFWSVVDAIAPGMFVAQALGRLGNYVNQELFGLPTNLPWGLQIDRPNAAIPVGLPEDTLFHPTFLYEMIWNLAGLVILLLIEHAVRRDPATGAVRFERRAEWQWGTVFGFYLFWYGLGRSWFESIRLDPSETFLGIRSNVWAALAALVLGLIIIIVQRRNHVGAEPSVYRPGKEWSPDAAVDSQDTYSESDDPEDSEGHVTEAAATSGSATGS